MNSLRSWVVSAILPSLLGCESLSPVELQPVGPRPLSKTELAPAGYLKVYSAIETLSDGDRSYEDGMHYRHTAYEVYDKRGKLFSRVANAIGPWDEEPFVIELPVGRYTVEAEAARFGSVRVPVIIGADRLTTVNLECDSKLNPGRKSEGWVRVSNGQAVGYRANPGRLAW